MTKNNFGKNARFAFAFAAFEANSGAVVRLARIAGDWIVTTTTIEG